MVASGSLEIDFIEELRMRRWARENYVPPSQRNNTWHPVIHEEMQRKENEGQDADLAYPVKVRC